MASLLFLYPFPFVYRLTATRRSWRLQCQPIKAAALTQPHHLVAMVETLAAVPKKLPVMQKCQLPLSVHKQRAKRMTQAVQNQSERLALLYKLSRMENFSLQRDTVRRQYQWNGYEKFRNMMIDLSLEELQI